MAHDSAPECLSPTQLLPQEAQQQVQGTLWYYRPMASLVPRPPSPPYNKGRGRLGAGDKARLQLGLGLGLPYINKMFINTRAVQVSL